MLTVPYSVTTKPALQVSMLEEPMTRTSYVLTRMATQRNALE